MELLGGAEPPSTTRGATTLTSALWTRQRSIARPVDSGCVFLSTFAVSGVQAQLEAQKATQDFQRATEVLRAAKETISLAEQRLLEEDNRQFDSAWQEMLNHATQRVRRGRGGGGGGRGSRGRAAALTVACDWLEQVMEAEQSKTRSELLHRETAAKYTAAIGRMKQMEKKLKRTINKSK